LPRHLDRVLRDGGAQNIVQPGDAFDFFLSRGVRQDDGIVLVYEIADAIRIRNGRRIEFVLAD